jgi:hypothetical protein
MAKRERRPLRDTGESWLWQNADAFRRGYHAMNCRWCDSTLDVVAVTTPGEHFTVTECPACDRPGPSIEGGPLR